MSLDNLYHNYTDPFGNSLEIVLDDVAGVPIRYGYGNYCYIVEPAIKCTAFCDKDFMINIINNILDEFGENISARSFFEHDFSWIIEWGMKPLEEMVTSYKEIKTIQLGRKCALQAAEKAQDKFYCDDDDYYDYFHDYDGFYTWYYVEKGCSSEEYIPRIWGSIKIELSFCPIRNIYSIHTYKKRSYDDSITQFYISKKFDKKINEINTNLLWNLRKNYIKFLEGLPLQTSRDNVLTYLFDDGILKAVCEFMS